MKRVLYAFAIGFFCLGVPCFMDLLIFKTSDSEPKLFLIELCSMFIIGFIAGLFDYDRKMRKKEEEEQRIADQEHTNQLMREYLEKKLREETKDK